MTETNYNKIEEYVTDGYGDKDVKIDLVRSEVDAYKTSTAVGNMLLYTLPTGKELHVHDITINNDEASDTTIIFYEGTPVATPKAKYTVGANDTIESNRKSAITFSDNVYFVPSQFTLGSQVTISGILVDA